MKRWLSDFCLVGLILVAACETPPGAPAVAQSPPMGWNSWDCFGCAVTEDLVRQNAEFMAKHLASFGWKYVVVEIRWYESKTAGFALREPTEVVTDGYGRLLPDPKEFPSSANGNGFGPLADEIHGLGLKFGIHLMRGIPRKAVEENAPVLGSKKSAADIADPKSICSWNPDMFGVDMTKTGAQEYYDSVFALLADWGVDFVKIDDLSSPYYAAEIEAVRKAIDRSGRPIVFSTSPGDTPLSRKDHIPKFANAWRVSGDIWDDWPSIVSLFDGCRDWASAAKPGAWPDADILPLGSIRAFENDRTRLSPDEQVASVTLHLIARSPLMFGGHLPWTDDFALSLVTNRDALAVNQAAVDSRELWRRDGFIAWTSAPPESPDRYLALFNTLEGERRADEKALYRSPVIGPEGSSRAEIDVDLRNTDKVFLAVDDAGDGAMNDHAAWVEPVLIGPSGPIHLTDLTWASESAGYRYSPHARVNQNLSGGPLFLDGNPVAFGIGTHANSLIEYDLPAGVTRLRATGVVAGNAQQVSESDSRGSVRFLVFGENPTERKPERGRAIMVDLEDLGFAGPCVVRDLWSGRDLGRVENAFESFVPWHGAGLFRFSPTR